MSDLTIAILSPDDVEAHVQLRGDFVRDMLLNVDGLDWNHFFAETRHWVERHLNEKSYLTYVGYLNGTPAAFASLMLYTLPPLPGRPTRLVGHLLNFYTYPDFRRRGFGTALIKHIKADAPKRGIHRLFLNAAPMGERLYRRAGFVEQAEKALVLEIP